MDSPFFLDSNDRRRHEDWLTERLTRSLERVRGTSVSPTLNLEDFSDELGARDFAAPEALESVLEWTISRLESGGVHMTHPRYFGLFNPSPTYPAECADRIGAALNPQICVLSHAPVAVLIEQHVIRQLGIRLGLGAGFGAERAGTPPGQAPDFAGRAVPGGHFTSGGSEANATSVICALTRAHSDFAEYGCRVFEGQPRLYVSRESHLAWLKIAHSCGMGRRAVRLVETDGQGRMCAKALEALIENDMANGDVPVMIAATFGTTNAGMMDPIRACSELCKRYNAWLHIDAAWGGALVADSRQHALFEEFPLADSVTVDAHKWFATTMGTGMFLTPHTDVLEASFHAKASYMPSGDAEVDYYLTSLQWSRRFSGLRLFLALASGGWEGFARHMRRGQNLIETLNAKLEALGWQVASRSPLALTCLVPPLEGNQDRNARVSSIVDRVVQRGNAWISKAVFEDQPVIRVCITNGYSGESDVEQLVEELERGRVD